MSEWSLNFILLAKRRFYSIESRLRSLGWGKELDELKTSGYYILRKDSRVMSAKPLTEKGKARLRYMRHDVSLLCPSLEIP